MTPILRSAPLTDQQGHRPGPPAPFAQRRWLVHLTPDRDRFGSDALLSRTNEVTVGGSHGIDHGATPQNDAYALQADVRL